MPRCVLALVLALAVVVLDGAAPAVASGESGWRRPLPGGAVVGSFAYERSAPYARGRRRGIDLAGRPGAPVLAACAGVVTHAGRVPGFGRGVTLRCGRLAATELGLGAVAVQRGARVPAGAVVGRLGESGVLRLGARVAADRQGYVDPQALLEDPRPGVPGVAPAARPRRRGGRPHVVAAPARAAVAQPAAPAVAPVRSWPVLAGAGLLAAGLAGGGGAQVRRRRRRRAGMALAQR